MAESELVPCASVAATTSNSVSDVWPQHDFNSDLSGPRRSEKWEHGARIAVVGLPVYNNFNPMTHIYSLALYTTRNLRLRLIAKSAHFTSD